MTAQVKAHIRAEPRFGGDAKRSPRNATTAAPAPWGATR